MQKDGSWDVELDVDLELLERTVMDTSLRGMSWVSAAYHRQHNCEPRQAVAEAHRNKSGNVAHARSFKLHFYMCRQGILFEDFVFVFSDFTGLLNLSRQPRQLFLVQVHQNCKVYLKCRVSNTTVCVHIHTDISVAGYNCVF